MQLNTIGKNFYPDSAITLKCYTNLDNLPTVPLNKTYQIIIIEEGTGIIKVNENTKRLDSPSVYCINETETISIEKGHNLKIHVAYFHPEIIENKFSFAYIKQANMKDVTSSEVQDLYWLNIFLARDSGFDYCFKLTNVMLHRFKYLLECIIDEFENQRTYFWICKGRSFLLEILCYLTNLYTSMPSITNITLDFQSELYEEILLYIHTSYAEKISLKTLVDKFNVNRTTLNEIFKKMTGDTIISYLIKVRVDLASSMLSDTGIPIKEIASRVGFEDIVNFGRMFKKIKGYSPKNYRNENSWLLHLGDCKNA